MRMRWIILLALWLGYAAPAFGADQIRFWDRQQRGANSFNGRPPGPAYFRALRGYGASWVRLAYDKWPGARRDFLIGDADRFEGIPPADLRTLRETLDHAHAAGLRVVISPLSLPGARWVQNNGDRHDGRLWRDPAFRTQAAAFWREFAAALRDHPAVAAYNIVNEPTPEMGEGLAEHAPREDSLRWYEAHRGGGSDLRAFYAEVVSAIREVDPVTPIMLDMGWYAAADAFYWDALPDPRLLYAFHMYEPYELISVANFRRASPWPYPGDVPERGRWDRERVRDYLAEPARWARAQGLPPTRIVAGEFGCMRRLAHCPAYLEDVVSALEANGFHWAFYSFREDAWDGMDYELGGVPAGAAYRDLIERGDNDAVPRGPTPLFEPILSRLRRGSARD